MSIGGAAGEWEEDWDEEDPLAHSNKTRKSNVTIGKLNPSSQSSGSGQESTSSISNDIPRNLKFGSQIVPLKGGKEKDKTKDDYSRNVHGGAGANGSNKSNSSNELKPPLSGNNDIMSLNTSDIDLFEVRIFFTFFISYYLLIYFIFSFVIFFPLFLVFILSLF